MKVSLKTFASALKKALIQWNEFITVPLSILLFWAGGHLIRFADPTSALWDGGIFQIILFAVSAFLFLHGVTWFVIKLTFPKAYRFLVVEGVKFIGNRDIRRKKRIKYYSYK